MSSTLGRDQSTSTERVAPIRLHAFIDEAGQRSHSLGSSDHFVMSAVVVADPDLAQGSSFLAGLRRDLGRRPGDALHWRNLRRHSDRLHAAKSLAEQEWATICSVVVCKRLIPPAAGASPLNDDQAYLATLHFLLEYLSWLARDSGAVVDYTLAHVVRFSTTKLRAFESSMRHSASSQVAWGALDPKGGRIDQPSRVEMLQCADLAASATFAAFNADHFGNTEPRYLRELGPRLHRSGDSRLNSHELKVHPWDAGTKAAYPWVVAL
ncbi:DUF3800 domain-containing protein [Streptomyces sp. wa53]|uniref:DUF3800 domain-containing protein n=1 Tax=Streptomyces sp. wa53 TaxID=1828268 RepID=UPI003C79A8F5